MFCENFLPPSENVKANDYYSRLLTPPPRDLILNCLLLAKIYSVIFGIFSKEKRSAVVWAGLKNFFGYPLPSSFGRSSLQIFFAVFSRHNAAFLAFHAVKCGSEHF
jgi:hypothetical protein